MGEVEDEGSEDSGSEEESGEESDGVSVFDLSETVCYSVKRLSLILCLLFHSGIYSKGERRRKR